VVGELQGAAGFSNGGNGLYVQYRFVASADHWHVLHGADEGYTQVDTTSDGCVYSVCVAMVWHIAWPLNGA
jgi:Ciliary basal body-associated, B9 protein